MANIIVVTGIDKNSNPFRLLGKTEYEISIQLKQIELPVKRPKWVDRLLGCK